MRLLKISVMIGIFILTSILGCNNIYGKSLFVEALRRHDAYYWFSDKKDIEFCGAIEWDDTNKMEKMLKEGLGINKQGNEGMTFVIYSFLKNKKKSYEYLVEHGADQNIPINVEEKLDNGWSLNGKETSLSLAVGDLEDTFYLETGLKYGGNPNAVVGVHLLHDALSIHSFTNVQLLINAGANIDGLYETNKGGTPLSHSISSSQYDIAYYLLQKGANPELVKDSIIFYMYNYGTIRLNLEKESPSYEERTHAEWYEKVKKILEDRGFDFSFENFERIKEKNAENLKKRMDEAKNR